MAVVVSPASVRQLPQAEIPKGAAGKTFGFVYSGEFIGGGLAPLVYGFLLDAGGAQWIFWSSTVFFVLCGMMFLGSGRVIAISGEPLKWEAAADRHQPRIRHSASPTKASALANWPATCEMQRTLRGQGGQKMALNTPSTTSSPIRKMIRMIQPSAFNMPLSSTSAASSWT